jgi:outer membrane autotransporter protein
MIRGASHVDRGVDMRLTRGLTVMAGLALLVPFEARAQSAEDCAFLDTRQIIEERQLIPGCLKPVTNRQSLIGISNLIHRLVARELLAADPVVAEPAGLVVADPADALSANDTFMVAPAADVVEPVFQRKWNLWIDGKYSWIDGGNDISDSDGPLINVTAGIDYKITDDFVFGLMFLYENSDLETSDLPPIGIGVGTDGLGGGAYLGITLTDEIVFSALVNATFIDNDYDLIIATASTDSERVQASAGFTGYFYSSDLWRWSPSITVAWSGEWIESYRDSLGAAFADQTVETAVLSLGNQFGKTIALGNSTSIEPWAGAIVEYTFLNRTDTDGAPSIDYDDTVDIRVQAGLNLSLTGNAELALTGEVAGLLIEESDTYAGEATLAIQF